MDDKTYRVTWMWPNGSLGISDRLPEAEALALYTYREESGVVFVKLVHLERERQSTDKDELWAVVK